SHPLAGDRHHRAPNLLGCKSVYVCPRFAQNLRSHISDLTPRFDKFQPCDRGRKRLSPSPPSEPCVRFSRTRLSSRWFPHRDWLANTWASVIVKSPMSAKKALGHHWPPLTPFSRPGNLARRSV